MTTSNYELFIPYNNTKEYLELDFVRYESTNEDILNNVMVVKFREKEYALVWSDYDSYWSGTVDNIEGYSV